MQIERVIQKNFADSLEIVKPLKISGVIFPRQLRGRILENVFHIGPLWHARSQGEGKEKA